MSQAANGLACCCLRKIAAHLSPYSKPETLVPHPTTLGRASQSCNLCRLPQETASSSSSSAATHLPRPTALGEVPTAVPRRGAPLRIKPLQDMFLGSSRVNRLGRMEPPPPSTSHTTPPEEFAPAARGCSLATAIGGDRASRRRSMEAIVRSLAARRGSPSAVDHSPRVLAADRGGHAAATSHDNGLATARGRGLVADDEDVAPRAARGQGTGS
jgi:hypothetical protein